MENETVDIETLTERLVDFVGSSGCCLFAGAGVGMHADLPSWEGYVEYLSKITMQYEKETATLMRKRIASGHYTLAAHYYKTCIAIPKDEMYRHLAKPFLNYNPKSLYSLMTMPFCSVVTTNYDFSLHDAYAALYEIQNESGLTLTAPQYVELGDPAMRQAIYWKKFFIARIHGRAEVPKTIIIDTDDYKKLEQDDNYQDFLFNILTRYRCLFIGYSFLDPAIKQIFELIERKVPSPYKKLHLALVPSDSASDLITKLAQYNIQTLIYDQTQCHKVLWEAIKKAQKETRTRPRVAPDRIESIPGLKRFVASTYARLKVGGTPEPLFEIVVEGIVAQSINDRKFVGSDMKSLVKEVKNLIGLPDEQLKLLVTKAVDGLINKNLCIKNDNNLECISGNENEFNQSMKILIDGACNRLKVREGIDATKSHKEIIDKILNKLFLSRGWDLGAHFAGGRASDSFDAWDQIQLQILQHAKGDSKNATEVSNAIFDLIKHPENKEAEFLADIGRVSFGIELAMNNAQSFAARNFMLPKTLYFDSNVLMPAIVNGHPYSPAYRDAIKRLQISAASTENRVKLFISNDFLNEIINHRRLAIEQIADSGLENPEKLKRHILLFGAAGTNVFIGAYASWVGRQKEKISFKKFLAEVAPYSNEDRLSRYLDQQGIKTIEFSFQDHEEKQLYIQIKDDLREGYETFFEERSYKMDKTKAEILIDHEAAQLTRLILDIELGRSPIFVTADTRLMSLCHGPILGKCANSIMSHLGFVQMIDLVLGLDTDRKNLSRLVWSIGYSDEGASIRNYLIDLALQQYDDAMTRAMWEVIDDISEKTSAKAKEDKINFFSGDANERARTAAFFDRVEDGFFENMVEVIRKRELSS